MTMQHENPYALALADTQEQSNSSLCRSVHLLVARLRSDNSSLLFPVKAAKLQKPSVSRRRGKGIPAGWHILPLYVRTLGTVPSQWHACPPPSPPAWGLVVDV